MKTTVVGQIRGNEEWLSWEDGRVDGSEAARGQLLAIDGPPRTDAHLPSLDGPPDLAKRYDWFIASLAVFGPDVDVHGPIPHVAAQAPGEIS